jgi:hypothetical protein
VYLEDDLKSEWKKVLGRRAVEMMAIQIQIVLVAV